MAYFYVHITVPLLQHLHTLKGHPINTFNTSTNTNAFVCFFDVYLLDWSIPLEPHTLVSYNRLRSGIHAWVKIVCLLYSTKINAGLKHRHEVNQV